MRNVMSAARSLWPLLGLALWAATVHADSTPAAPAWPAMAPVAQYMMDRDAEIALARTGAPASIAPDVGVLVLGPHGYETAVKGTNGFVCYVGRSWENDFSHPEFWEPDNRAPECVNAIAAAWYLPIYRQRTEWVLAGVSKEEMIARTQAAIAAKQISAAPAGAMCYMLSKQGMLGHNAGGPWHPHVMFWGPPGPETAWGANVAGSPIVAAPSDLMPFTMYFIPVRRWSDGTLAEYPSQPQDGHHSH